MSEFEERCPRLYRAHCAELDYQRRLARGMRTGFTPPDVAAEAVVRAMRKFRKQMIADVAAFDRWMQARNVPRR